MTHAVRISDGMGNQMFQYAFAYALMRESGDKVLLDPLFWGTSLRKYQLDEFNISMNNRMVSEGLDYLLGAGPRNGRKFKDAYRNHLIRKKYKLINEKEIMHYDEKMLHPDTDSYYMGFWQTPRFFEKYREDIRREFALKRQLSDKACRYADMIREHKSVAMHVRRTDYVRETGNVALDLSFYERALAKKNKKTGSTDLYIFSDDKEFVKNNLHLRDYTVIEGVNDIEEFELMRRCDHHVIANSTFSWWAAYLKDNREGLTIAPKVGIWTDEFYSSDWILLEADT